jgi:hypothetical protein
VSRRRSNYRQARTQGAVLQTPASDTSEIDFHRGEVLYKLSNTYRSLPLTLIEGAQNAIDAGADRVMLCIDLKRRTVLMVDNGEGTTKAKFDQALASVGKGVKSADKLGRFGLGLISPLNKCTRFHFISALPGRRKALKWTFVQTEIRTQHVSMHIPCEEMAAVPGLPKRFNEYATEDFDVQWRTRVEMIGVTRDKVISLIDLDELEQQIRSKLGLAMRSNKVSIRVVMIDDNDKHQARDITPTTYSGEPLEVVSFSYEDAGLVEFQLFRAAKHGGKRTGQVSVMASGDSYPITWGEFTKQARGRSVADIFGDSFKVLGSGYFEGLITCQNIELHPERTKFEYNDALESLYWAIDQWYTDCGREHYQLEEEQSQEARYQETALKAADRLREFLGHQDHAHLWSGLLSVVKFGRLGEGHLDPEVRGRKGDDDGTTLRSGQGRTGTGTRSGTGTGSSGGARTREPRHRPGDLPVGAKGPSGQRRKLVKGDSEGFWFGFEPMPGNSNLWEFEFSDGSLVVNTRHPIWVKLDETNGKHLQKNARWIQQLLEWLAFEVLHLLVQFPEVDDFEQNRSLIDDKVKNYVEMFIVSTRTR